MSTWSPGLSRTIYMTEQELRAIVRDAIARHAPGQWSPASAEATTAPVREHSSHALFAVPAGADTGGPCVIEPAVPCNHCGYCKSYGH
jgi:hypothetical protein